MPNLRLTHYHPRRDPEHISWRNLVTATNYFEQAGARELPVVDDGERAHPELGDIYRYLLGRGFAVRLSTSGLETGIPDALESALEPERTHFILSVRQADADGEARRDRFLGALGRATSLRLWLDRPDPDPGYLTTLLDLLDAHGLRRRMRLDLAHPLAGGPRGTLTPDRYGDLAGSLGDFARQCDQRDVVLSLGCGFTLCDFTDEQLGALVRCGAAPTFGCAPHLDILPDLTTRHCFALPDLEPQPLEEYPGLAALAARYRELKGEHMERSGHQGVHAACTACRHLARGQCAGGCGFYALASEEGS